MTAKPLDSLLNDARAALDGPRPDTVVPALEVALAQYPDNVRLLQLHGLILRRLDRHAAALTSLQKATALAPADKQIAHALARSLFEAGLPSVEAYGRALQLSPGDPEIIAGLTAALLAEGQGDTALAGLAKIVARSPLWAAGQRLLSDLRWADGTRADFTSNFDDALRAHPGDLALRREQIHALGFAEHWDKLLSVIAEGRAAMGDQLLFDVNEAVAFSELGDLARAEQLFAPLAVVDDAAVQLRAIRHLLRAGRPEEAVARIEPWLTSQAARNFWPYASIAWRLTNDPRWAWLEGDPRFVGIYDIADRLPPLDQLADKLRSLHKTRAQPLEQSVRGGTQTDGNIFQHVDPMLVAVREAVRGVVADHVGNFGPADPAHPLLGPPRSPIAFSGAWSVRLTEGGSHSSHVHPMGWISSALYVVLPSDLGHDQAGWLTLGGPQAQLGLGLPPLQSIEPKPGRLVLFPSTMWHGTQPFQKGERLTVAFDVAIPA